MGNEMELLGSSHDCDIYYSEKARSYEFKITIGKSQDVVENTPREKFCEFICSNIISKLPPDEETD